MARVIKHFEGNGTGTPYTVPAGKVAQIQGLITFVSADVSSTQRTGNFTFGDTTVFMAANYLGHGLSIILNSDATQVQPVGASNAGAVRAFSIRAGSTTLVGNPTAQSGPVVGFSNVAQYTNTDSAFTVPAPRIYIGAGDSLSFTQGTDAYIGYNIIAIEEDV